MLNTILKLALKAGAHDAVLKHDQINKDQIRFANCTLTTTQSWQLNRLEIFLTYDKRAVATTIDFPTKEKSKKVIKDLIKLAKLSKPKKDWTGLARGPFKYKKIKKLYDKRILNVNIADKVNAAINSAQVEKVAGVLYRTTHKTELITSNNVHAEQKGTQIEISVRAFDGKESSGHAVSCARMLKEFDPERAGAKAGLLARLAKRPREGNPGKYTVLFDPLAFANLIDLTGSFSSAFYVESGFSFLANKIGKNVASEQLTLLDSPDMPAGFGSQPFDDEGVPTYTKAIINSGILNTYLHNTTTARKYLVKTTANAGLINPRPFNLVVKPGLVSKDNIVEDLRNALYITNVWYTRFQNYTTGEFSTIPRDAVLVIRNGDIVGALKGLRISENLEGLLKKVIAVSKESECIHWWEVDTPVYTPYALIEDVNITKPTL